MAKYVVTQSHNPLKSHFINSQYPSCLIGYMASVLSKGQIIEGSEEGKLVAVSNNSCSNVRVINMGNGTYARSSMVSPVKKSTKIYSTADGDTTPKPVPALAQNLPSILGSAGMLGGLYYAFQAKSGFWGFVGYGLLGSIAGHLAGNIASSVIKPKA